MADVWLFSKEDRFQVRIEVNDQAMYAYFLVDGRISGMTWLMNRASTPPGELSRTEAPANPWSIQPQELRLPTGPGSLQVTWLLRDGVMESGIYLDGMLVGVVGQGDLPGWAMFAGEDSPLARRLADN